MEYRKVWNYNEVDKFKSVSGNSLYDGNNCLSVALNDDQSFRSIANKTKLY